MKIIKKGMVLGLSCLFLLGTMTVSAGKYCDAFGHNFEIVGYTEIERGPTASYCYEIGYYAKKQCKTCGYKNPINEFSHSGHESHFFVTSGQEILCYKCGYEK